MTFNMQELAECAEHAVKSMRRRYPGYIATRRLHPDLAERRIAMMEEIARKLREMQRAELLV